MVGLTKKGIAKYQEKKDEKYFQTLRGHTYDALKILKKYLDEHMEVLTTFCNHWNISQETFLRNLFIAIYLHDIGKLTAQFQRNIKEGKHSSRYPHAYFFLHLYPDFPTNKILEEVSVEVLAILGHHTQLYKGIYDNEQINPPHFLYDEIKNFVEECSEAYQSLGFKKYFSFNKIALPQIESFSILKLREKRNKLIEDCNRLNRSNEKIRLKSVFSYFFSILQICDDYSSVNFKKFVGRYEGKERLFDAVMDDPSQYITKIVVENPLKTILGENQPYKFQWELFKSVPPKVFLFAPCGRGKTEASLLWAVECLKKYHKNKIVFAMPTQTTSNAMYDRLCRLFDKENVGLYHGTSFIKLESEIGEMIGEEEVDVKDPEEIQSETFKGKVFFKPVTVTTIDHLLLSFVHGFSQADFALGNLLTSVIIFDEVHYYEKLTLEHIITLIKLLERMDVPHLLMSGTLPEFLISKFNHYPVIKDEEGLEFVPFKIEFMNQEMLGEGNHNIIEEIFTNFKKGFNQFVILNTVERTKSFYSLLKPLVPPPYLVLYHSQFIFEDRIKKERTIMEKVNLKPFILVATQVIEVSLDISCDIMYTELAPPDAIGQRAGRLNRKGKSWKSGNVEHYLKIFKTPEERPYPKELMRKSEKYIFDYLRPVSYKDVKAFCDVVYHDYKLEKGDFFKFFVEGILFGRPYWELRYSEDDPKSFKTREEKFQTVEVIPKDIFEKKGEKALSKRYTARIQLYRLLEDKEHGFRYFYQREKKIRRKVKKYWITTFPYSFEIGFDFKSNSHRFLNII